MRSKGQSGDVLTWGQLASFAHDGREWAVVMAQYCPRDRVDQEEFTARYGESTFLIMSVKWQRQLCQGLLRREVRISDDWRSSEYDEVASLDELSWIDHAPIHTTRPSKTKHKNEQYIRRTSGAPSHRSWAISCASLDL